MLKGRSTQRTGSTHILSAARELTRLELVTEAVRAVLEAMAHHAPEALDELVTAEWAERYGRPVRLCSQPSRPVARLAQVGADARELLGRLHVRFPGSALPAQAEVLRQILVQHFLVDGRGRFRPRPERDGRPPSRVRIESPHETEARWTRRGDTRWTGPATASAGRTSSSTSTGARSPAPTGRSAATGRTFWCRSRSQ